MGEKISREERILGLSRIWRDVKYCFARFYELLLRFVATLNDGHTYVLVPDEIRPPYNIAIGTTYIDGKHILIETPKKHEDFLYAEILSVNGRKLEEYLGEVLYPLAWHESKTSRFFYGLLGVCYRVHGT